MGAGSVARGAGEGVPVGVAKFTAAACAPQWSSSIVRGQRPVSRGGWQWHSPIRRAPAPVNSAGIGFAIQWRQDLQFGVIVMAAAGFESLRARPQAGVGFFAAAVPKCTGSPSAVSIFSRSAVHTLRTILSGRCST